MIRLFELPDGIVIETHAERPGVKAFLRTVVFIPDGRGGKVAQLRTAALDKVFSTALCAMSDTLRPIEDRATAACMAIACAETFRE